MKDTTPNVFKDVYYFRIKVARDYSHPDIVQRRPCFSYQDDPWSTAPRLSSTLLDIPSPPQDINKLLAPFSLIISGTLASWLWFAAHESDYQSHPSHTDLPKSDHDECLLHFRIVGPDQYRQYRIGTRSSPTHPRMAQVQFMSIFLYIGMPTIIVPPAARYRVKEIKSSPLAAYRL